MHRTYVVLANPTHNCEQGKGRRQGVRKQEGKERGDRETGSVKIKRQGAGRRKTGSVKIKRQECED